MPAGLGADTARLRRLVEIAAQAVSSQPHPPTDLAAAGVIRQCPALNSVGYPCRSTWFDADGRCGWHGDEFRALQRGAPRRSPPTVVEVPTFHPDYLPSLRPVQEVMSRVRAWAAEFDSLDDERYTALQFVAWLELEAGPAPKPLSDYPPSYPVLGVAAVALGG